MIRIVCIQTHYTHWASHSGYHQFLSHLGDEFLVEHVRVPKESLSSLYLSGINRFIFSTFYRYVEGKMSSWSYPSDVLVELKFWKRMFLQDFAEEKVIVHFLDGEVGYNFSGFFRKFLLKNAGKVRLLASYHQPESILQEILPWRERIKKLDAVLTVGTSQLPFFSFLSEEQLKYIPHGVDTDFYCPLDRRKKTANKVYCLTVGHWLRDFDCLERIIRIAPKQFVFRIVAGQVQVERFRNAQNVELYSGISDEALLRLYQESDFGLMPLKNTTANNGILEMMACGLPIISSLVGSVTDYLSPQDGVLMKKNVPEKFLAAMIHLSNDTEERCRLRETSRHRALELDWGKIALEFADLYRQV